MRYFSNLPLHAYGTVPQWVTSGAVAASADIVPNPSLQEQGCNLSEKELRKKIRNREYKIKNRDKINAQYRARYAEDPERFRAKSRKSMAKRYAKIKSDPALYSAFMEKRNNPELREKARIRAAKWRKEHKKRYKRQQRFRADRDKAMCRQCPEFYAMFRAYHREHAAKRRRKLGLVKKQYRPRMSMRIPDSCSYGRVLDTRSVFLWNNLPAASLVAGRAFQALKWRDSHCDRFGRVVR